MKRPLFLFSAALILGIIAAYFTGSYIFIAASITVLIALSIYTNSKFTGTGYILAGIILFYSIGALEYLIVDNLNKNRFNMFSGKDVVVEGIIISEPDIRDMKVSYLVRTLRVSGENNAADIKGKILLSTLKNREGRILDYGQAVEIRGELKTPSGQRNPGGFNYQKYLSASGISCTIFARSDDIVVKQHKIKNYFIDTGLTLRRKIIDVINKSLPKEQAGLLNGMLIGYRDGLSKDVQDAFSDAGLSHIMAVSGANIAFIVAPMVFLFKRFGIRHNEANPAIILSLVLFVYITGFSPSVVRAVIMAIVILLAQIIKRETDVITSISFAAMLLLLYNPCLLFDIGFQLSFVATLSLVLFYKPIKEWISFRYIPGFVTDIISVTLAAQIGIIPLTAFYFNKISVISFISNILVVPLTGVITVLGLIMAIAGQISMFLAQITGYLNYVLLTAVLYITKISSNLPFAVVRVVTPPVALILTYYAVVLFVLWYRPKHKEKMNIKPVHYAGAALFAGIVILIYTLIPGRFEVIFLDVGQGDCAVIKTHEGKTVIVDGGGTTTAYGNGGDVGEKTVIPFLMDYGISKIDMVIATHEHDDHIQGLIPVMEELNVKGLTVPDVADKKNLKTLIEIARKKNIPVYECFKGGVIRLDKDTSFDVLHPMKKFSIEKSSSNNGSLVLKLHYRNISILLTGDIEQEAEEILLNGRTDLKADILKVAHHGSVYSTTEDFFKAVSPKAAIISVGRNNFGHPAQEVAQRILNGGTKLFRTDECGAVIVKTDGKSIKIKRTVKEKK